MAQGDLTVAAISAEEHVAFVEAQRSASFLQTWSWGAVKAEWRAEAIGWRDASGTLVGAGLVLHRPIPKLKRFTLAYLPEGPVIDWADAVDTGLDRWLDPMAAHLKQGGAFGIRMGPPVVTRRWSAAQVKEGLADPAVRSLRDLPTELDPVGQRVDRAPEQPAAGATSTSTRGSAPASRSTPSRSRWPAATRRTCCAA